MAADISQDPLHSLFKDGISEDLYKLMWSKDELNFGPSINIPDTIVYKYGQPVCWYFTASNGKVKRKNKHNLMSAKIEEVFNKHVLGYDVLAYFINIPNDHDPSATGTTIEYLDRTALNDFLYNHKKEVNGFLQRFIEPKTTHNEVIRAIWSPKVCLLERAENIHQLHDHRYGLYERCVIYEGPEYYFTSAPLRGPVLSGQIQKLCETVVSHIGEVTFGQKQITRIVLNFKVDSRDKIWLLYSTSIRCVDMLEYSSAATSSATRLERTLVNIDSVISLSGNVALNPMKSYEKIVPKARIRCLSCTRDTLEDLRHPVPYKTIIKHYDHVMHLLTTPVGAASHGHFGAGDTRHREPAESIQWPPDKEIIEAAGGVGFGLLFVDDDGQPLNAAKLEHHLRMKHVKDLQIPPMIHSLHAKLNAKSYQRCKTDPLFLYKTLHVCEPCYLVYAEFSSMLLRMGQDLTKLLTPDPFMSTHTASVSMERSSTTRPSSADWRAISTANGSMTADSGMHSRGEFRPSANHRHAKSSAIGLRTSSSSHQPTMPDTIRKVSEQDVAANIGYYQTGSVGFEGSKMSLSSPGGMAGDPLGFGASTISSAHGGGLYNAEEVKSLIADRERHFFKEISLNPQLKDQHPLMHLISAQQKLKLVDQQSGVLTSKAASQTESVFGTKYGKQKDDTFQKYQVYGQELPYAINGEIVLPSTFHARKREELVAKKAARQKSLASLLGRTAEGEDGPSAESEDINAAILNAQENARANQSSGPFVSKAPAVVHDNKSTQASKKHREFLSSALQHIEAELDGSQSFVGKYSGPPEDASTATPQQSVRSGAVGAGKGKRKVGSESSRQPSAGSRSAAASEAASPPPVKLTAANVALANEASGDVGLSASNAPSVVTVDTKGSSPSKKSAQGSVTSAASAAKKAPSAAVSPIKPEARSTSSTSLVSPSAKKSPSAKMKTAKSVKGVPDETPAAAPAVGSMLEGSLENVSLSEASTESALLKSWGIQLEPSLDSNGKAEDRRTIMESSNEIIDRRPSLDSLGENSIQSTESALLDRWGVKSGGSVGSNTEEDNMRILEESNALYSMLGQEIEGENYYQQVAQAALGGDSSKNSLIRSLSNTLITDMLRNAVNSR